MAFQKIKKAMFETAINICTILIREEKKLMESTEDLVKKIQFRITDSVV